MPWLEGMYAPGNECAHMLPPAGFPLPYPSDVFRFNRVAPFYPPDPCIRPNEGDITCPPQCRPQPVNYPRMPPAGTDTRMLSDVFRFYKVYPSTSCNPCKPTTRTGPTTYPCMIQPRYPPSKPSKHFDFRYPAGVTACNAATHKRGHVPQDCNRVYPEADEMGCLDKPQHSDCATDGCNCEQCAGTRSLQMRNLGGQSPVENSSVHGFNMPPSGPYNSNVSNCTDASMYNNASTDSAYRGQGDGSSQRIPNPCAITSNVYYKSPGYSTDRSCTQMPVQRADKVPDFSAPCPHCPHPYYPSCYVCRPVYNRKYLMDCPDQDGPPADTYTFL